MKSADSIARIAAVALFVIALAAASFAATNPLNQPSALAVDSAGNLLVANRGTNSILAFSPSYTQLTSKTINDGISSPDGLAVDSLGNLWVANYSPSNGGSKGSVSVYTNGVQNTAGTITSGIASPVAIAIDSLGNVWITNQNDGANNSINVYANTAVGYGVTTELATTFAPTSPLFGLAFSNGSLVWSTISETNLTPAEGALLANANGVTISSETATSMASAAKGLVYMGNSDGSVDVYKPATNSESLFVQLSVAPQGIAVDTVRGRVYLAQYATNQILVYSTAGKLLHTIE